MSVCVYRLFSLSFFLLWIYTLVKMCVSCDPPPTFSRSFLPSLFHVVYKVARLFLYICVYRRAGGGGLFGGGKSLLFRSCQQLFPTGGGGFPPPFIQDQRYLRNPGTSSPFLSTLTWILRRATVSSLSPLCVCAPLYSTTHFKYRSTQQHTSPSPSH